MSAQEIIRSLQLKPHVEGGFFRRTYQSSRYMITDKDQERVLSTAIYYLLSDQEKSHFHRIQSDEIWFFHQGETIEMVFIREGILETVFLGNNLEQGEVPQAIIPANTWFAAKIKDEKGYGLVSCIVAPGFEYDDFELGNKETLINEFPQLKAIIEQFT